MKIICRQWRAFERNTLRGFADFEIAEIGLLVKECTVHCKDDRQWIGLPGKPQVDKSGAAVRDQSTGKVAYTNVLQFVGRSWSDEFNRDALIAISSAFPGALNGHEQPERDKERYRSHRSAPAGRLPSSGNTSLDDDITF
jgi:hypothetical protein